MNYRLLATDFDDTLLSDDFTISEKNRQALAQAKQNGLEIAIVTGREYKALHKFWDGLDIGEYGVVLGGAQIVKRNGEVIDHRYIAEDKLEKAYEYIIKNDLYCNIYTGFSYCYNHECEEHDIYTKITNNSGEYEKDISALTKNVGKVLIAVKKEDVKRMYKDLYDMLSDSCHVTISKPTYIELTNIEATKGSALLRLINILGIKKEETIAIGDGPNDITMIEEAGLGVAVLNAADVLKERADYIAPSNNDNAVAHVIEKFI